MVEEARLHGCLSPWKHTTNQHVEAEIWQDLRRCILLECLKCLDLSVPQCVDPDPGEDQPCVTHTDFPPLLN